MKFGDYLRQKREELGFTQPEAAARADIEQSYLSKLETGKSYPSEEVFDKLVTAYGINIKAMGHAVQSDELEKLKDIAKVRSYVLKEQKSKRLMTRAWLVAGLVLMMTGGGLTFYEGSKDVLVTNDYIYRSDGLLKPEDGAVFFETIGLPGFPKLTPEIAERMVPKVKHLSEEAGEKLVETEGEFIRIYRPVDIRKIVTHQQNQTILAVGVALLIGSFGCFIIGFRWD